MSMRARERASIVAVMAAMALVVLDAGLVNVALPSIAEALHVSPAQATRTVSAYQTGLVIGLLPSAHLAERLGYKRLFVVGLSVFSLASILCGFAPTLGLLVVARLLQGLGGAAVMALGIALLRFALGAARLGRAIGWNAMNVALCSAAGPITGALILSAAPWPWLFFVKLPVIAIALVASVALPEVVPRTDWIDHRGLMLHASIVGLVLLTPDMAPPFWALSAIGLGGVLALAMMRRERRRSAPIWPVDLLGVRAIRVSVAASVCCFIAQSAGMLALPFHLQLGLGYGPVSAGIVMACWPLTVALTSMVASPLADRFGSARLCVIGSSVLGSGLLLSGIWPAGHGIVPIAFGAALSGLGFGLFQVPNNRTMFLGAKADRSAAAGGMQGTARLAGQAIGALSVGSLLAMADAATAPRLCLGLGAVVAVAAALVSRLALSATDRPPPSRSARPLA